MTIYKIVKDLIRSYDGMEDNKVYAMCTERLQRMGFDLESYCKAEKILLNELKRRS
jgi:hypothetical protein